MKTSNKGINLLKQFEGFRSQAYLDPVGIWTLGYGFIEGVSEGDTISHEAANERLRQDLLAYENAVSAACLISPNKNQFDAMVCFAWNVGITGFKKSSVLKAHNRRDFQAAARAFGLWNKAGGRVFAGLTRRRAAEAALYLEPSTEKAMEMPQAIDSERTMSESNINRASVATGAIAAVAGVSEVTRAIGEIQNSIGTLGDLLNPVLLIAVAVIAIYIIYQRCEQRKQGWA